MNQDCDCEIAQRRLQKTLHIKLSGIGIYGFVEIRFCSRRRAVDGCDPGAWAEGK
jgi:hypothetical protein